MDSNKGEEEGVRAISPARSWVRTLLSVPLGCVKVLWLTQWYLFVSVGYVVHFCIAAFKWMHNAIQTMGNHKGREIAPGIYEIERGIHDVDITYMHKYKIQEVLHPMESDNPLYRWGDYRHSLRIRLVKRLL